MWIWHRGDPKYCNLILDNLIDVKDDGSFEVNQKYFVNKG